MNVTEFIDHVVMLMRDDKYERMGWDDNCVRIAAEGKDRIVVAFEDGSEFELTARPTTADLQQAGVRYWLSKVLQKVKSKKAKDVVREAQRVHG